MAGGTQTAARGHCRKVQILDGVATEFAKIARQPIGMRSTLANDWLKEVDDSSHIGHLRPVAVTSKLLLR